jgi:hypothetical protein
MIQAMALLLALAAAPSTVASQHQCEKELAQLIVPALRGPKAQFPHIQAEIVDGNAGVYNVRLFAAADGPDRPYGTAAIGWVQLDTHAGKVFDITEDPDQPQALAVDRDAYRRFVEACLR